MGNAEKVTVGDSLPTESGVFPAATLGHPLSLEEDRVYVEALLAGDSDAWRVFQARYGRLLLRCIGKVTRRFARVGPEDVREIYASLLVQLLQHDKLKLRSFDARRGTRFASWLGLLSVHAAYDYLRTLRREPQKECLAVAEELAVDSPDPFEQAARREHAVLATRMVAAFTAREQAFATLYFEHGLTPEDIAQRLRISVKTVYSKRHKIQTKMEAWVQSAR